MAPRFIILLTLFSTVQAIGSDAAQDDGNFCEIEASNCPVATAKDFGSTTNKCFRAAILETDRVDEISGYASALTNLKIFDQAAKLAANHGANIIVFPENGIFSGLKETVIETIQEIPDPDSLSNGTINPCLSPSEFKSYILTNLSCIARKYNLYLVANFGTKQPCEFQSRVGSKICPEIGYFALNTDVVFDSDGNFIKRYRKYNMFIENFDQAPSLEEIYFDSPFGRFGIFTCFDILFKQPAIDLVEKYAINTAIFPTFWYDELPLLSAINFQDAWSLTHKVNLLAANIHRPAIGSVGSGIYSGDNMIFTGAFNRGRRLIVASLPAQRSSNTECSSKFNPVIIDIESGLNESDYSHKHYDILASDTVSPIEDASGEKTIKSGELTCSIKYRTKLEKLGQEAGRLVVIARDSLRQGRFNWYEQLCVLATLKSPLNALDLKENLFSTEGIIDFEELSLTATFNTRYVYPIANHNVSELVDRKDRQFSCDQHEGEDVFRCTMNLSPRQSRQTTILSFGLYGRVHERDQM